MVNNWFVDENACSSLAPSSNSSYVNFSYLFKILLDGAEGVDGISLQPSK